VYEHITFFSKSDSFKYNKDAIRITDTDEFERWWVSYPERYSPKGIVPSNVWEYPIPKQGQWGPKVSFHPSPFPEGLVARIIKLTTDPGDVVFDPFAGIGTTLAIAEALGRKPLGFELNQDYIDYYEKHVRPTALREVGTEQDTLYDEQVVLQGQIYTLRIQKYAYKLYKHLVNSDKKPIREGQIEFIHVTADPREFEADHYPNAEIQFVCDDSDMYDDVSLDDAMKEMLSEDKGSGDYYGVEFHPQFTTVSEYLSGGIRNENLYLYTDGNHNWSHQEFSREEWHSIVSSSDWLRYWSKSWPPLVSSLSIQVENPVNDERHEEIGYQSEFGSFQNGPT
jgi:hypothetical protein